METLPTDLVRLIALKLDGNSISKMGQVFKNFQTVWESDLFWKLKLLENYPNIDISEVKEYKKLYQYLSEKPNTYYTDVEYYIEDEFDEYNFIDDIKDELVEDFDLEKGDIIYFDNFSYRPYVWDGENFFIEYDEFFVLPPSISFPDFPPYYFDELLDFTLIYFSRKKFFEVLAKREKYVSGNFGEKYEIIYSSDAFNVNAFDDFGSYVEFSDYRILF